MEIEDNLFQFFRVNISLAGGIHVCVHMCVYMSVLISDTHVSVKFSNVYSFCKRDLKF